MKVSVLTKTPRLNFPLRLLLSANKNGCLYLWSVSGRCLSPDFSDF